MRNKKQKIFRAGISLLVILAFVMPVTAVLEKKEAYIPLSVDIAGPYSGFMTKLFEPDLEIAGGVPPYSKMFYWGDGSSGNYGEHAYFDNEDQKYTLAVIVKDSRGTVAYDSTRVSMVMPSDTSVYIDTYVKKPLSKWGKHVNAVVGDVLNMQLLVELTGSEPYDLMVFDEMTKELAYIEGSASIEPDMHYPGTSHYGDVLVWNLSSVQPGQTVQITFDVLVEEEFNSMAFTEVMAGTSGGVNLYLGGQYLGSAPDWIADYSEVFVSIREKPGHIWIVDDDGSGDFTKIQEAVDAASNGDTIKVMEGTYVEHVEIEKSLKIIGAGIDKSIVDADQWSYAFRIMKTDTTIQGFTLVNALESKCAIYVDHDAHSNTLKNNKITGDGFTGVYCFSDNNIITDNVIGIRNGIGIDILGNYNLIKRNTLRGNNVGVILVPGCHANDVYENKFIGNRLVQAYDGGFADNHWTGFSFTEERMVGNYWSDYDGKDLDGDGLGDTPYVVLDLQISPGILLDLYPIME